MSPFQRIPFFCSGTPAWAPHLTVLLILAIGHSDVQARQSPSDSAETGFLNRTVEVDGRSYRYQVYVPANYDSSRKWPLILFLHGAGERGYDGLRQTQVGLGSAIRLNADRWSAIAVFPQLPSGHSWSPETEPIGMLALDATMDEFAIDDSRVYLTGLSMGGYGALFLSTRHAQRFAAVIAVCPTIGGTTRYPFLFGTTYEESVRGTADALAATPVWLFHGENDPVFAASNSQDLTAALQERGADVRYTEYVDTGHNAWDPAYENTDMITWLFQQRKH